MPVPEDLTALRSLRDFIRWGASEFNRAGLVFGHGTGNALDEAFHLVLWRLGLPFDLPATYLESALSETERTQVHELLQRRVLTRKPAPYLTGEAWFCGEPYYVDERVLIPRSPIGELIAQQFAPWLPEAPQTILDLCAGSGCIGIACALAFPDSVVELAEIDAHALPIIERNILRHGVESRVRVATGDLFAPLKGRRFDLIVSNPPYVPHAEWAALPSEFHHEPRLALEAGLDGMDVVARILAQAPAHLHDYGWLICEIGGSREEFDSRFPELPAIWPDFEQGGDGVFVIAQSELLQWQRKAASRGSRKTVKH